MSDAGVRFCEMCDYALELHDTASPDPGGADCRSAHAKAQAMRTLFGDFR